MWIKLILNDGRHWELFIVDAAHMAKIAKLVDEGDFKGWEYV